MLPEFMRTFMETEFPHFGEVRVFCDGGGWHAWWQEQPMLEQVFGRSYGKVVTGHGVTPEKAIQALSDRMEQVAKEGRLY